MARFKNWKYPKITNGKLTKYNWMVQHKKGLVLGKNTDIGAFTYINAKNKVIIEEDVQIGSHCSIYSESTIDGKKGKVVLKKNCKIGAHSVIMPNVTIGENSIIGVNSFVNKSIPANVVAFGNPIKMRWKQKPKPKTKAKKELLKAVEDLSKEHLQHLKILEKESACYQVEIRNAIHYAVLIIEKQANTNEVEK